MNILGELGELPTAQKYFKDKFEGLASAKVYGAQPGEVAIKKKQIYTHFTTNTDTNLMRVIINTVCEIIIRQGMQSAGFDIQ